MGAEPERRGRGVGGGIRPAVRACRGDPHHVGGGAALREEHVDRVRQQPVGPTRLGSLEAAERPLEVGPAIYPRRLVDRAAQRHTDEAGDVEPDRGERERRPVR